MRDFIINYEHYRTWKKGNNKDILGWNDQKGLIQEAGRDLGRWDVYVRDKKEAKSSALAAYHVFQYWIGEICGAIHNAACLCWHRWWKSRCFKTSECPSYPLWSVLSKDEWTTGAVDCTHLHMRTCRHHDNPTIHAFWDSPQEIKFREGGVLTSLVHCINIYEINQRNHCSPEYRRPKGEVSLSEAFNGIKTLKW